MGNRCWTPVRRYTSMYIPIQPKEKNMDDNRCYAVFDKTTGAIYAICATQSFAEGVLKLRADMRGGGYVSGYEIKEVERPQALIVFEPPPPQPKQVANLTDLKWR